MRDSNMCDLILISLDKLIYEFHWIGKFFKINEFMDLVLGALQQDTNFFQSCIKLKEVQKNWLSTQVQNSFLSFPARGREGGTLSLSWGTTHLNSFNFIPALIS